MKFESIPEILEFSISKEQASIQFYRDLLLQLTDPTTKALFSVLIKKEQEHVAALELEIEKLGHTVNHSKDRSGSVFHWEEQLETDDSTRNMSFVEALLLAIQKERAAFRLYAKLLGTIQDEELSEVLLELAEEEMRHVLQLEHQYEVVMHHKD